MVKIKSHSAQVGACMSAEEKADPAADQRNLVQTARSRELNTETIQADNFLERTEEMHEADRKKALRLKLARRAIAHFLKRKIDDQILVCLAERRALFARFDFAPFKDHSGIRADITEIDAMIADLESKKVALPV